MQIDNATPLVANAVPMQAAADRMILSVMAKATYSIEPDGELALLPKQPPLAYGDTFHDDDPLQGSAYESDLVPFKPRCDVVVNGSAIAPNNTPVEALEVKLTCGDLEKRLLVVGDRHWLGDKGMPPIASKPEPFTEMPITYAYAFGGADEVGGAFDDRNPFGKGVLAETTKKLTRDVALPNIEDPDQPIKFWKDRPTPAGFGFIGRGWQPRVGLLGTYDEQWQETVCPAPPADFSSEYYNGAPPDQQVEGYLQGDEVVEVSNMHPTGTLRFQLPGQRPIATVTKGPMPTPEELAEQITNPESAPAPERHDETVAMNMDTLVIDANDARVTVVWRGFCFVESLTADEVRAIAINWAEPANEAP